MIQNVFVRFGWLKHEKHKRHIAQYIKRFVKKID